jgi:hypothetical protein
MWGKTTRPDKTIFLHTTVFCKCFGLQIQLKILEKQWTYPDDISITSAARKNVQFVYKSVIFSLSCCKAKAPSNNFYLIDRPGWTCWNLGTNCLATKYAKTYHLKQALGALCVHRCTRLAQCAVSSFNDLRTLFSPANNHSYNNRPITAKLFNFWDILGLIQGFNLKLHAHTRVHNLTGTIDKTGRTSTPSCVTHGGPREYLRISSPCTRQTLNIKMHADLRPPWMRYGDNAR